MDYKLYKQIFVDKQVPADEKIPDIDIGLLNTVRQEALGPHYIMRRVHAIKKLLDNIMGVICGKKFPWTTIALSVLRSVKDIPNNIYKKCQAIQNIKDYNKLQSFYSMMPMANRLIDDIDPKKLEEYVMSYQTPIKELMAEVLESTE